MFCLLHNSLARKLIFRGPISEDSRMLENSTSPPIGFLGDKDIAFEGITCFLNLVGIIAEVLARCILMAAVPCLMSIWPASHKSGARSCVSIVNFFPLCSGLGSCTVFPAFQSSVMFKRVYLRCAQYGSPLIGTRPSSRYRGGAGNLNFRVCRTRGIL